jgi:hypothetical protein
MKKRNRKAGADVVSKRGYNINLEANNLQTQYFKMSERKLLL